MFQGGLGLALFASLRRNNDEDANEELYSFVTVAEVPVGPRGLSTKIIEDED